MAELLFYEHQFSDAFPINEEKMRAYFHALEQGYQPNPYHNSLHAADVAQAMHVLLRNAECSKFTDVERLAVVFAALIHDFRHPGVNSCFLQSTFDPIAVRYNFTSVLENMHSSEAMAMLLAPESNFLAEMPQD
jgi:hypothetical protein